MINTKERNRKIIHLIESVIRDHCRIYNTVSETIDDGIIVYKDEEPSYTLEIEFNEDGFDVCFYGIIFYNLEISEVIKLRGIYKEDSIAKLLADNSSELLFYEDQFLMTKNISRKEYKNYSILKTAFAMELYEQINDTAAIKNFLVDHLEERESVVAN
jgi:hypothetical protein